MADKDKKKDEEYEDFVVAPMNVDGMPWYEKRLPKSHAESKKKKEVSPLTKQETRQLIKDVIFTMIPVAFLFLGAFALLILFMTEVWLR